tara:strand:- start:131 stop:511 length:381 start_codon:yes stop_codon:yes gene_type:complete
MYLKIGSNKSFGIVFFLFFLIVSIFPLFKDGNIRLWSLIIAIIFLILGLMNSKILTPLNKIWFKFGILLGFFVSPIVMGLVFFAIVTPTSLIMRILGKNLLNLKKGNKRTYWIKKLKNKSTMRNQF